ncbi:carbohydrate binding domain-containing protein [Micromonospora auratinigra]|uniref:mannan endo-1,4-beta-mannosidase n=1 Tax=Micromonospora auratinigra TaxID=261654 RepID=A0A1A8ZHW2_9ACTN|nr:cellulase family glycosylhydrolase [Micromonospora auratinigra]SBT43460.1 Carbohydrate binding domain (family 11) [Micromonospora auratinigra]
MRLRIRRAAVATVVAMLAAAGLSAVPASADVRHQAADPSPSRSGTAFVVRDGTRLSLAGRPFRFAGPNAYWLGLDENVGGTEPGDPPTVDYPTYFRIRDGLTTARRMGATVVRAHTLGVSTGNPRSLEPALGEFNPAAFDRIDYAIAEARRLGLRLIIPLTDNWQYYHGGRYDFLRWLGLSTDADGAAFYTDPRARAAYKQYVRTLLTHVNRYTGTAYTQDPTILAWELGNELNGMTPDWVDDTAGYVKSLAPRQLVAAGSQHGTDPAVLASPHVDISDSHYYPPTAAGIAADAAAATAAGKVYLAGEYGSGQATDELLDQVAANPDVTGALFWSLFGHHDHHGYVPHGDGFTVHYPGDTPAMRQAVAALTRFAGTMAGRPAPAVTGDRPLLTAIDADYGINTLRWRGTAGAAGYLVQRRAPGRAWATVSGDRPLSADAAPWFDLSTPTGPVDYRVVAVDAAGSALATATPVRTDPTGDRVTDPLEDWYVSAGHSDSLRRTPTRDGVLVAPARGTTGELRYRRADLTAVTVTVGAAGHPRVVLEVSADGTTGWRAVRPRVDRVGPGRYAVSATGLPRVGGVRVRWTRDARFAVASVDLAARSDAVTDTVPGAFTLTAPAPDATGVSRLAALDWSAAPGAAYYSLTVSAHADLSAPLVAVSGLRTPGFTPTTAWPAGSTLYVRITAVNGYGATTANASFTTRADLPGVVVDDFDTYPSDAALAAAYPRNGGGDPITATLAPAGEGSGHSMLLSWTPGASGYAGVIHNLPTAQDWRGTTGLRMWVRPGSEGQQLTVQFVAGGFFWEKTLSFTGTQGRVVEVPFGDFAPPPWATPGPLDLGSVTQLSLYPGGASGAATVQLDSISAYAS